MRRLLSLLCLASLLATAGCGDDDDEGVERTPADAAAQEEPAAAPTARPAALRELFRGISRDLSEKPAVPTPSGPPPGRLVKRDLVKGDGSRARAGDQVSVRYYGSSWSTGQPFDSSWDHGGAPYPFTLGDDDVIDGWHRGIGGMRVGGRRVLVVPPDLGYGDTGSPPAIAPNETLIFVVDLERIRS